MGRLACLLSALGCGLAPAAAGEKLTIQSDALRLEVQAEPYAWRLIDRATGKVLLEQAETSFVVGGKPVAAASAAPAGQDGRTLRLRLALTGSGAAAEAAFALRDPNVLTVTLGCQGAAEVGESFKDNGEHVYGIWESTQARPLDNRGESRALIGTRNSRGSTHVNARAPFYVTSGGYGVYAETTALGSYRIALDGRSGFRFRGEKLTWHVLRGPTYADVMRRYSALAGPAFLPPTWALGTIVWRDATRQAELLADLKDLRRLRIPASAMWLDRPYTSGGWGWGNIDFDPKAFPDPKAMMRALDEHGMKLLVWIANRAANTLKAEGEAKGYLFGRGGSPAADLRKEAAYKWFVGRLKGFAAMGVRGYKIDRGAEGEMPDEVQNENVHVRPVAAGGARAGGGGQGAQGSSAGRAVARRQRRAHNPPRAEDHRRARAAGRDGDVPPRRGAAADRRRAEVQQHVDEGLAAAARPGGLPAGQRDQPLCVPGRRAHRAADVHHRRGGHSHRAGRHGLLARADGALHPADAHPAGRQGAEARQGLRLRRGRAAPRADRLQGRGGHADRRPPADGKVSRARRPYGREMK